jgi:hypothetical protein
VGEHGWVVLTSGRAVDADLLAHGPRLSIPSCIVYESRSYCTVLLQTHGYNAIMHWPLLMVDSSSAPYGTGPLMGVHGLATGTLGSRWISSALPLPHVPDSA